MLYTIFMFTKKLKSYKLQANQKGFTLVELLVYVGIFSIVSVFLTGILITTLRVQDKNVSGNEVNSQLNLVLQTTQRLVRESSLIEDVFEGTSPSYDSNGDLSNPCTSSYCSVQLRMENESLDPTIIRADSSTKQVYLKQGSGTEEPLTNDRVMVDSLIFTKNEIPGAHATLQIDATISYVGETEETKTARAVVARVSAATFDSDLLPNTDDAFDVGQSLGSARWKNAAFSGNLSIGSDPQTVYRCTSAGTLPAGALTTVSGSCGAAEDTGLRVK